MNAFPRRRDASSGSPQLRLRSETRSAARLDVTGTASEVRGTRERSAGTVARTNTRFGVRDDGLSAVTARGQRPRGRGAAAGEGNSSEGVNRVAGKGAPTHDRWLRPAVGGGGIAKRSEPRSASGCNKPEPYVRSKPSRWCETTRAERVRVLGSTRAERRRWLRPTEPGSGRTTGMSKAGHTRGRIP